MSSVPRMRGKRFLRTASRKPKQSKAPRELFNYEPREKSNPVEAAKNVLNAIDHLGDQRFVLPPFSEHFQRWHNEMRSLVTEFNEHIPDAQLQSECQDILQKLQDRFSKQTEVEKSTSEKRSKIQGEMARLEHEISKLEKTYRSNLNELRVNHDRSNRKLRMEITQLDTKRLRILRQNPTLIQRIMRKSIKILEGTTKSLEAKKEELRNNNQNFESIVQNHRNKYATERQKLTSNIELLKQNMETHRETGEDDALQDRKEACQQIHAAMDRAIAKTNLSEFETDQPTS